jgi:hypothetical protein
LKTASASAREPGFGPVEQTKNASYGEQASVEAEAEETLLAVAGEWQL